MAERKDDEQLGPHQHLIPDGRKLALGKLEHKEDERTLDLQRYLIIPNLPEPGPQLNLSHAMGATPWGMYDNDKFGDCTAAGVCHEIMLDAALIGQTRTPTQGDCFGLYEDVTEEEGGRFDPKTGANDNGCVELDVLARWRKQPVAGVELLAYTAVKHKNMRAVRQAMSLMGGLYIGIALPQTAQDQTGKLWDYVGGSGASPGSWGGHCVTVVDYDFAATQHTITCVTWGGLQVMTEAFWNHYVDEAWATLTDAWKQRTPSDQFNFDLLSQDLQAFGQVNPKLL